MKVPERLKTAAQVVRDLCALTFTSLRLFRRTADLESIAIDTARKIQALAVISKVTSDALQRISAWHGCGGLFTDNGPGVREYERQKTAPTHYPERIVLCGQLLSCEPGSRIAS